jgi:SAM-dependent methyltransferase
MTDPVKYDRIYETDEEACGEPYKEIVMFVNALRPRTLDVLDLGCGQGRDALLFARAGHHVLGVDLSKVGVQQMLQFADTEGLDVTGVVQSITDYEPASLFDVVILDRVLHMLDDDAAREQVLIRAGQALRPDGALLVVDYPRNMPFLRRVVSDTFPEWERILDRKNVLFLRRTRQREPSRT